VAAVAGGLTQHSLPGVRYDLPGPDFHRLDNASLLAHRRSNPGVVECGAEGDGAALYDAGLLRLCASRLALSSR